MRNLVNRRLAIISAIAMVLTFSITPSSKVYALSGDATVYLTKTGECYHADGCRSLSRSKIATTLSNAVSRGYRPCSNCHPGTLDAAPSQAPTPAVPATPTQPATPATSAQPIAPAVTQVPITPATQTTSGWDCIYNETYYRTNNPDVDKVYPGDSAGILQHFKTSGMKEGRRGCEEFDVTSYRAKNADLNAAFGDDLPKYYYHYMNTGKAEGRSGK